jgi:shikimate dehydrogenase
MSGEQRFLLLGDPVEHSRSPQIHRAALEELGLAGTYHARRSDEIGLTTAIEELRGGGITGINVTMPLKAAAADACDDLTEEANASGSVNTLRCRGERVEGHSTDVLAMRSILDRRGFAGEVPLLVLGAGGAAKAAVAAARGRALYISARNPARAQGLADTTVSGATTPWGVPVTGAVVVNATPLGMTGESLPGGLLEVSSGLIDLAYGELDTPAVRRAEELQIPVVDGIEFLAVQAAASLEWWLGVVAPLETMLRAARKH